MYLLRLVVSDSPCSGKVERELSPVQVNQYPVPGAKIVSSSAKHIPSYE